MISKTGTSYASVAVTVLASAFVMAPASAQQSETNRPTDALRSAMASADGAADASEEILVTAQRRAERLTDVPLSITAVSGNDLARAGVSNLRLLSSVASGLTVQSTGPWLQPAVRGVSSQSTIPGSEQNVALYIDGVYQPTAAANASDLPDVERIEVLKGPQGTLFGRNATGGAIQIFTLEPGFTPVAKLLASYGRFNDLALQGYISTPVVSDKIAISLTGSHTATDGWLKDLLNNGKRAGKVKSDLARGKLLVRPSEAVKFVLSGFYTKRSDDNVNRQSALDGNALPVAFGITPFATKPFETSSASRSTIYTKSYGSSLRADIDTGVGTVTSTTAYLHNRLHLFTDGDQSPVDILRYELAEPHNTYSQEFVFASEQMGRFRFTSGAFAFRSKTGYSNPPLIVYLGGAPIQRDAVKVAATSYAGFTEGTYAISEDFLLTGGLRYTWEKRTINKNFDTAPIRRSSSSDSWTPRVSAVYKFDDHSNAYFTFSRGFKSGQYDTSGALIPELVKPETLTAYELGYKRSRAGTSFEAAAFYYDYKNVQQAFLDPATGTGRLENAGGARIYGIEATLRTRLTDEFRVSAQGSYLNAKFRNFQNASITVPTRNANGIPVGGNDGVSADLSGFRMPRVPRFSGNIAATYEKEFTSGVLEIAGNIYYSSNFGIENASRIKQPSYVNINGSISWTIGDTGLKVGIYGNNLANEKIFQSSILNAFGDYVGYLEPINYGVRINYSF